MKLRFAAALGAVTSLAALVYTQWMMLAGLAAGVDLAVRQSWLLDNRVAWDVGLWLWLLAISAWMLLHVTVIWSYLPAHRIATMLQSGLLTIAAVLGIVGVVVWMAVLPTALAATNAADFAALIDALALGLLGAALLMGGLVTAWQAYELATMGLFSPALVAPPALAGLIVIPSPFLFPGGTHIIVAVILWAGWCLFIATRRTIPHAYTEWR